MNDYLLTTYEHLFWLSQDDADLMRQYADGGDTEAQYAYGRWLYCTQPDEQASDDAYKYLKRACEQGLPDAIAALSDLYYYGEGVGLDRDKANELLGMALSKGSRYALEIYLKSLVHGLRGLEANPTKAIELANEQIRDDETHGTDPNPIWHYMKGLAKEELYGRLKAVGDYETAAQMGLTRAWLDLTVAWGYGDNDELQDRTAYLKCLKQGGDAGNADCLLLLALARVERWDDMPTYTRLMATRQLEVDLERAAALGSRPAAITLGDAFCAAQYGFRQDDDKAWQWYSRAAELGLAEGFERLFDMVSEGFMNGDLYLRDELALRGARIGSERLLAEVVIARSQGRLNEYQEEIERHYEPVFDEDDGRYDAYV